MKIIIVFGTAIFLYFLYGFFLTRLSKIRGTELIRKSNESDLNKIEVKIAIASYSAFRQSVGLVTSANMFYSESMLIFTRDEKSILGSLRNSLPIKISVEEIKWLTIKSDEYIVDIGGSDRWKRIQIYSDTENEQLRKIFSDFQQRINGFAKR